MPARHLRVDAVDAPASGREVVYDQPMFPVTRTSTVLDLASDDPERRARSRVAIAQAYWKPIYKYLRVRWSAPPDRAEDLAQSFFETALERDVFARYQRERGRFRAFLRACLDRHVIDDHRKVTAKSRFGETHALDFAAAEAELVLQGTGDPDALFEAEWLRHLMQLAVDRLAGMLESEGKATHLALFREFHLRDEPPSYADAAARHQIAVTTVTNWLHATRRRFKSVALELLGELTVDESDFASEAMAVFGIDVNADV